MALPNGIYKRGRKYWFRIRVNGKQVRKPLSTDLAVAREMAKEIRTESELQSAGLATMKYSWAKLRDSYIQAMEQTKRPATADGYRTILRKFEAACGITESSRVIEITEKMVLDYRASREGRSERTINKEVGTVVACLSWGTGKRKGGKKGQARMALSSVGVRAPFPLTRPGVFENLGPVQVMF